LANNNPTNTPVNQYIVDLLKKEKPESVDQLVKLVQQKYPLTEQEILKLLTQLENEGKMSFSQEDLATSLSPSKYVISAKATWYWITIASALATTIAVFTIPEDAYPAVYIRYILGSIFVLWLPGYTFIKALFPTQGPVKTSSENLDALVRIALSAGMSLALVPIVGLFLNYTPWGIRLAPITLSLLALTIVFSTAAVIREYQETARAKIRI
jgi:uncharacterized membrane protein